jgi:hypothetical protein
VLDNLGFNFWQGQEIFLFSKMSRMPLVPTQPINGYWGAPSLEVRWVGHKATTDLHLVLRLRMSKAVLLLLLCSFMTCTGTT